MDFVVQPNDLMKIAATAQRLDANPLRFAGRVAGLGSDELEAGVPAWAWVIVALGVGAAATIILGPKLRKRTAFLKNWRER